MNIRSFGKNPSGERLEKVKNSPNFKDGSFQNVEPTSVNPGDVSMFKILKKMLSRPDTVRPSHEVPHVQTNLKELNSQTPVIVWFGHSSYFIHIDGYNVLIDPVFSGNASPFRFFGKAFEGADSYGAGDFPKIDLLVLTHDHYDHLDWPSIRDLDEKVKKIVTSLGVGSHLEYWGVASEKITELDWWEEIRPGDEIDITATPTRHFSGRGFKRAKTLWSSFVLNIKGYRFFLGGDSGYDNTFRKIGEKFGPFDLAFLECGQYGKYWPQIHMFPEQTVMAANDLQADVLFPVHWGKFVLSTHPWNESVKRLFEAAKRENRNIVSPKIGEAYYLKKEFEQEFWWDLK
jgi:L-ascorbate metabolism protein UlaG (beta-lactamase superfamily)